MTVTGFVVRESEPAGQLMRDSVERGLRASELLGSQQLIGHAQLVEDLDVALRRCELCTSAKELQSTGGSLFVTNVRFFAQRTQAVTAVFREPEHPLFVDGIALG